MDYCAYVACPAPPDIEGLIRSDNHDKSTDAIHNFTTIVSYVRNDILFTQLSKDFFGHQHLREQLRFQKCADDSLHFESDRDMKGFDMTCIDGGKWIGPTPTPRCITDKGDE